MSKLSNAGIILTGESNGNHKSRHHHDHHANGKENQNANSTLPLGKLGNVENPYTYEVLNESAQFILSKTSHRPKIAIICGSGLGGMASVLENKIEFPYEEIPHFPVSTVIGHAGKLVMGQISDVTVMCMQGRFHNYEGYPLWKCSMPVRVFKLMGIEILIVTNAAGGLNPNFKVGDIMLLKDHLNLHIASPLQGPNDDRFGPRFPPMTNAYCPKLRLLAKQVAGELGLSDFLHEGVYTMLGGPSFETVAELRALKAMGVDAVGMSTVPEVIAARHTGIKCFAFSLITNACITEYDTAEEASHQEVLETADKRQRDLQQFMTRFIPSVQQLHLSSDK